MRLDEKLNPVPDLAERIAISDDGLTYTFTLRANAGSSTTARRSTRRR
ncbi:MAG: hypothetical protein U0232_28675 [Thermomicrobiales bacterium]